MMALPGFIAGIITIAYQTVFSNLLSVAVWLPSLLLLMLLLAGLASSRIRQYLIVRPFSAVVVNVVVLCLAFILGSGYAHWQLDQAMQQRLKQPTEQTAIVRVVGISDGVGEQWRQVVEPVVPGSASAQQNVKWLLYSAYDWGQRKPVAPPEMQPGQLWQIQVKLKPAHSYASPGAFDVERWLLQQHIAATGTIQAAQPLTPLQIAQLSLKPDTAFQQVNQALQQERLRIRQHFMQFDSHGRGVLLGLLTGDRSLIDAETTLLYQQMGISHLLAISGPHVILAALMITWLLRQLLDRFPGAYLKAERRRWLLPVFMLVVLLYAGLAGFDIPAQRTVLMVGLTVCLLWMRRHWHRARILLVAASVLLVVDPLAILSVAFWLSFGAVAILLSMHLPQTANGDSVMPVSKLQQWRTNTRQFIHLQWRLFILLAPLVLLCFSKISWLAPVVNLLAIPLLSVVILPLNLLAYALSLLSPILADAIWQLALWILDGFHGLLRALAQYFPQALQPFYLSLLQLVALFAIMVLLILPKGILPRWWIVFLIIPVCYPARPIAPLMVQVLDVGQGLSILLKTRQHAMLVDAGGTFGTHSMGEKVVIPALQSQGIKRLDTFMLTHLDNDHSGGAPAVLQQLAVTRLSSNEPFATYPTYLCEAGQSWQWDGVLFRILSPLPAHSRTSSNKVHSRNERSCVLMVEVPAQASIPAQRVLIMGDAGFYTEFLLQQQARPYSDLKADLLILGHHGSQHSSSSQFLQHVQPQRAVVSAGYLNHYGHPAPIVLKRLAAQQIAVDSTIDSGSLTYYLGKEKLLTPVRYREQKRWLQRGNSLSP